MDSEVTQPNPEEVVELHDVVKPMLWTVVVKPREPKKETKGGIIIPDEAQRAEEFNTCVGEVIGVGQFVLEAQTKAGLDMRTHKERIAVGDFVIYGQYAGQRIKLVDGTTLVVLSDTDIICKTEYPDLLKYYL